MYTTMLIGLFKEVVDWPAVLRSTVFFNEKQKNHQRENLQIIHKSSGSRRNEMKNKNA